MRIAGIALSIATVASFVMTCVVPGDETPAIAALPDDRPSATIEPVSLPVKADFEKAANRPDPDQMLLQS